jgi:hypothetical protein
LDAGQQQTIESIQTRQDLASFIVSLSRQDITAWENQDLPSFLEAMAAWVNDMDGFFRNVQGRSAPDHPSWQLFAQMLLAATAYE